MTKKAYIVISAILIACAVTSALSPALETFAPGFLICFVFISVIFAVYRKNHQTPRRENMGDADCSGGAYFYSSVADGDCVDNGDSGDGCD